MKAEIGKVFRKLESYRFKVKAFGDNRRGRKAMTGWVDIVIYNFKYLIMLEIKTELTKDKLTEEQKETAKLLSSIMAINKTVYYFQIKNLVEANKLFDRILKQDL